MATYKRCDRQQCRGQAVSYAGGRGEWSLLGVVNSNSSGPDCRGADGVVGVGADMEGIGGTGGTLAGSATGRCRSALGVCARRGSLMLSSSRSPKTSPESSTANFSKYQTSRGNTGHVLMTAFWSANAKVCEMDCCSPIWWCVAPWCRFTSSSCRICSQGTIVIGFGGGFASGSPSGP